MATREEIINVLEILAAVYQQEPECIDAYYWTMDGFDGDLLEQAARRYVRESKWFPKPAELVNACQRELADRYDPEEDTRRRYWMAMSEYNGVLNGSLDEGILRTSKAFAWFKRRGGIADVPTGEQVPVELVPVEDR